MSLSDAKAATDRVLDGLTVEFNVADKAQAEAASSRLQLLGAIVQCTSN